MIFAMKAFLLLTTPFTPTSLQRTPDLMTNPRKTNITGLLSFNLLLRIVISIVSIRFGSQG